MFGKLIAVLKFIYLNAPRNPFVSVVKKLPFTQSIAVGPLRGIEEYVRSIINRLFPNVNDLKTISISIFYFLFKLTDELHHDFEKFVNYATTHNL